MKQARASGVVHSVFNKRVNLSYHQMGVKKKTFDALKNFRTGVEGNISELKRAFGMCRALWKGEEGFKAYVWTCMLSYNFGQNGEAQFHVTDKGWWCRGPNV